jgi:uncharacterized membrane protein
MLWPDGKRYHAGVVGHLIGALRLEVKGDDMAIEYEAAQKSIGGHGIYAV